MIGTFKKVLLIGACVFLSHASLAFVPNEVRSLRIVSLSEVTRGSFHHFVDSIDLKEVVYYELSQLYYIQKNYVEEKIIDLTINSYLVKYTAETALVFLQAPIPNLENITRQDREDYLRTVSARVLGLLLYRLGGDGTDHSCQAWIEKQLPRATTDVKSDRTWYATYSGVLVDITGQCRELGDTPALFVNIQIAYDPIKKAGEIYVGVEGLLGRFGPESFLHD